LKYTAATVINFLTLLVGIAIGVGLAPRLNKLVRVSAAEVQAQVTAPQSGMVPPKVTPVTPMMTGGSIGVYLVLAHQVQADQLVVNGYDVLKLQQGELNLLARFVPAPDIAAVVNNSRATEIFTVANPKPAAPPAPATKP
jgi:hypothetical protein